MTDVAFGVLCYLWFLVLLLSSFWAAARSVEKDRLNQPPQAQKE